MESVQSRIAVSAMSFNLRVLAEPRGLIRILQLIFAIFAFATACSGSSSASIYIQGKNDSITASWSYPYNLKNSMLILKSDNSEVASISESNDVKPSAEFFMFVGTTSMIIALAFGVIYVGFDNQYRNNRMIPLVDLFIILLWSIFWLAASIAWAKGVSNLRSQTDASEIAKRSNYCGDNELCSVNYSGTYGSVIVSVIFGFLNIILWIGSAWFIFKETRIFRNRAEQQQQQQQEQQGPTVFPPTSVSNVGSPGMQREPQFR